MNLKNNNKLFLILAILGSFVDLFGFSQQNAQAYYVVGCTFLLIYAIYLRLLYFIALELIIISGHTASLLGMNSILQMILPILLSIQLLAFYISSKQLNNVFILIGVFGIGMTSIGLVLEYSLVAFIGSFSVAIYAFYFAYTKNIFVLIWAILNSSIAVIALIQLLMLGAFYG